MIFTDINGNNIWYMFYLVQLCGLASYKDVFDFSVHNYMRVLYISFNIMIGLSCSIALNRKRAQNAQITRQTHEPESILYERMSTTLVNDCGINFWQRL